MSRYVIWLFVAIAFSAVPKFAFASDKINNLSIFVDEDEIFRAKFGSSPATFYNTLCKNLSTIEFELVDGSQVSLGLKGDIELHGKVTLSCQDKIKMQFESLRLLEHIPSDIVFGDWEKTLGVQPRPKIWLLHPDDVKSIVAYYDSFAKRELQSVASAKYFDEIWSKWRPLTISAIVVVVSLMLIWVLLRILQARYHSKNLSAH